jgi:hypothetical protein
MPRIFKFSKFALKLYVPNASHMEQMKILLYTDSYDIAVEYTKGFTINDNEVKVIVSNNDFNNMNDGVIKYRVEGYIDNNYYVEERQSNYYLKTPSDYTSSDLTGIKEIFQDNGEGIMIINAVDYGVDGFSSVEIDANEYGQTKYSDGYYAGETEQKAKLEPIEITKNGTYSREDGYNQIHVNIEGKGPVETTYKFIGNNGYFENTSKVIEIDNNYVKAISLKNDGELTTSFCPLSDGYLYYISSTQHGEFYVKIENGKLYVKISEREGSCDIELNKWHLFVLNFDYFTLDGNTIQLSEGSVPTSISTTWYMGGKYLSTTGEFTEPLHFKWEYSIMNYFTNYHYRYIYIPYQEGNIIRYYTRDSELSSTNTYDFVNGPIYSFKRVVDGFSPVEVCIDTRVDLASISVQPEFSNLSLTIDDTYYTPYEGINTLYINNKELAREVYYKGIESDEKSFKSGELTISENGEYINSDVEEFYSIWMLDTTPYDGVWLLDDVMQQRIECRFRYTQEMLQGTIPWIFGKTDETNGFSNKNKFGLEVNGNDTEAWCNYWQNGKKQKIVFNYGEWVDFVSYPHPDYANKRVIECAGQYFEIDNPSMLNDNGRLKYCGVGALLSTDNNKEGQYIKNTKYLGELAYLRVTSNNVNVSYEPEYYPGADDVVLILRGSRWGARIINYTSTKYIRKSKITKTWDKVIVDVPQTGGSGECGDIENAREITITENGTYTSKYSNIVTGDDNFKGYAKLTNSVYDTGIRPNPNTKIELWWDNTTATEANFECFVFGTQDPTWKLMWTQASPSNIFIAEINFNGCSFELHKGWHHIVMSFADGLVVDGEKVGEFGGNLENEIEQTIYINGSPSSQYNFINGQYGMIKITKDDETTTIIPTADGFLNTNTGEHLAQVEDGQYEFNETMEAEGDLFKTIIVNVPDTNGSYDEGFTEGYNVGYNNYASNFPKPFKMFAEDILRETYWRLLDYESYLQENFNSENNMGLMYLDSYGNFDPISYMQGGPYPNIADSETITFMIGIISLRGSSLVAPWVHVENSLGNNKILAECWFGGFDCENITYINRVFENASELQYIDKLTNLGKSFTGEYTLDLSTTNLNEKYRFNDCLTLLANSVYNFAAEGTNVNGISYSNVKLPANAKQEQVEAWTNVGWVVGF